MKIVIVIKFNENELLMRALHFALQHPLKGRKTCSVNYFFANHVFVKKWLTDFDVVVVFSRSTFFANFLSYCLFLEKYCILFLLRKKIT